MKWEKFLGEYGELPIIEPQMVYAGHPNPDSAQVQLSRWVREGKLIKLARGIYIVAEPYRKVYPPVEYVANQLVYPSYVSLDYALAYFSLIPETVYTITSVTTSRPKRLDNELGAFRYRHIKRELFWGYQAETLEGFNCFVALPEKALLDRFYFWNGPVTEERIREMRFQNLEKIDPNKVKSFIQKAGSNKLRKGAEKFLSFRESFIEKYDLQ